MGVGVEGEAMAGVREVEGAERGAVGVGMGAGKGADQAAGCWGDQVAGCRQNVKHKNTCKCCDFTLPVERMFTILFDMIMLVHAAVMDVCKKRSAAADT